ncbi:MAG: 3-carboxy-cis,cis-muconate cycloisomerase [Chloroflexi bacterium]|nr:3-carboxy-cis,cis-muconate cycloisomerase [Chloroflexota bacterium]
MLFSPLYVPEELSEAVGDRAWVRAMLEAEAALAAAEASCGLIPHSAAEAIAACCSAERFDPEALLREARAVGNPAEPLVRALRRAVPADARDYVHVGATSQDIVDTAAMLVARRALIVIEADLAGIAAQLARLAEEHRSTLMAGRTLLQQALPITFGLKAAGWLAGVTRARAALRRVRREALAAQLGGAAGTLASLDAAGIAVLGEYARRLDLAEPALPWHTERTRMAEIAGALALTAGALDTIALDVVLLAQTEVGEVAEGGQGRQGGSSTLPHKRNPVRAVMARACARQAQAQAGLLFGAMAQEQERAAGAWQAEWPALSGALAGTGGAARWLRESLAGLEVRPGRMRANLDATGGLILAERVVALLAGHLGREGAHDLLRAASRRAQEEGRGLDEVMRADETVRRWLSPAQVDEALAPGHYLGSARAFVDRALALHGELDGP